MKLSTYVNTKPLNGGKEAPPKRISFKIVWITYSDSQKHESSCLLGDCFSCISPEPLELQKSYLRLFASLSKELSDEKRIFQIRLQNQLIFAKTLF